MIPVIEFITLETIKNGLLVLLPFAVVLPSIFAELKSTLWKNLVMWERKRPLNTRQPRIFLIWGKSPTLRNPSRTQSCNESTLITNCCSAWWMVNFALFCQPCQFFRLLSHQAARKRSKILTTPSASPRGLGSWDSETTVTILSFSALPPLTSPAPGTKWGKIIMGPEWCRYRRESNTFWPASAPSISK